MVHKYYKLKITSKPTLDIVYIFQLKLKIRVYILKVGKWKLNFIANYE